MHRANAWVRPVEGRGHLIAHIPEHAMQSVTVTQRYVPKRVTRKELTESLCSMQVTQRYVPKRVTRKERVYYAVCSNRVLPPTETLVGQQELPCFTWQYIGCARGAAEGAVPCTGAYSGSSPCRHHFPPGKLRSESQSRHRPTHHCHRTHGGGGLPGHLLGDVGLRAGGLHVHDRLTHPRVCAGEPIRQRIEIDAPL